MDGPTDPIDPLSSRWTSGSVGGGVVARRVDFACESAGFPSPPAAVHLKPRLLRKEQPGWTATACTDAGKAPLVARWLSRWQPLEVTLAEGLAPRSLRAEFPHMREPWRFLTSVKVDHMVFTPQGTASFMVEDFPVRIRDFVEQLSTRDAENTVRVREYHPQERGVDSLTRRQEEVVSLAVALGYYEVPRKVGLREIARRLELSLGATSELLRRGESLIVSSYIDTLISGVAPGEDGFKRKETVP